VTLLTIQNLKVYFYTYAGVVKALDGVNLSMEQGEVLGLVGETGSGKSVTAHSILRLVDPPGRIVEGRIMLDGEDLLAKSENEMTQIRGKKVSMIFQDPTTSLNPVFTIGSQITEVIRYRRNLQEVQARQIASYLISSVYLPNPEKTLRQYPHELSGGMQQRIMIALAISCSPLLLIADEPTTSLDVTIQSQILNLLEEIQEKTGISIIWISHDLHVVAEICDRVCVMYAGNVVESALSSKLYSNPQHPYTSMLFETVPDIAKKKNTLSTIKGTVPNLIHPPTGCRFHPRCPMAKDVCKEVKPSEVQVENGHFVSCHLYD
jgi:oligopeptide/dipeptide ABC transporter ATP-binding protein